MAYKTVSICRDTQFIVKVLREQLGYTVTNLREILVNEFGYKSANDIQNKIKVTSTALYAPLVYHDSYGRSLIVKLVNELLEHVRSGKLHGIDCWTFRFYGNFDFKKYRASLHNFRAEIVYEEHILLLLNQNKFINYESSYYLP
jgi:hypothetical protein